MPFNINTNLGKEFTTHMSVLVKVLQQSQGNVVEMGAGPFSTPLLHWVTKEMGRSLITYESIPLYYEFARQFRSKLHRIVMVSNWNDVETKKHRGVVFIDHDPEVRRGIDALRFKDSADYIVMHDTQSKHYNYDQVWPNFKYEYTWKKCRPWVSVVSNFKDLSNFE